MCKEMNYVALFDFDGVVMDTESQYTHFWHQMGVEQGIDQLDARVKGQTLRYIFDTFFQGQTEKQRHITEALDRFETEMEFLFVPGVVDFIEELHRKGVATAVVTSSNAKKMEAVYRKHPQVKGMFDRILTAEMFRASKPDPHCYLLGMELLGGTPDTTFVFEDSINGLKAGMASGAHVIGLTTTFGREQVAPLCHRVIDDFTAFTAEDMLAVGR